MTDYTPSTRRVRAAYVHGVGGSTWYQGKAEALLKQFDRWLFEMQEDAWDRGYQAGVVDFAAEGTNNPYRQAERLAAFEKATPEDYTQGETE